MEKKEAWDAMTATVPITEQIVKKKWIGKSLARKEDRRFITGQGQYTGDLRLPNLSYAIILRSPYAHAKIVSIDVENALALPGVFAVITGKDVANEVEPFTNGMLQPPYNQMNDYGIAVERARYVGEPIAVVVAADEYIGRDAADLINIEYENLPAVLSPDQAMAPGCALVHENFPTNVPWHKKFTYGDVDVAFGTADLVVHEKFYFHRFTSSPLEPNAVLVNYDRGKGNFTIWSNNQRPANVAANIAKALKVAQNMLRFISPDIGGGFGIKVQNYMYILLIAIASRKVGRPVQWNETRQEHLLASNHGNEVYYEGDIAVQKDGTIIGLRARAVHDEGAYMRREPVGALNFIRHASLTYKFKALEMDVWTTITNKCPVGPSRVYGKMQQNYLVERLVDSAARKLGMDPVQFRQKNFVGPESMPYQTPTGAILDGGDYPQMLQQLILGVDYNGTTREVQRMREEGKVVGVGVAMAMDSAPLNGAATLLVNPKLNNSGDCEAAFVRVNEDASIIAAVGTSPQGSGHETSVSQIVADILQVDPYDVYTLPGFDMWTHPYTPYSGTYASRFAITGASAIYGASMKMREKIIRIAAHLMEKQVADIELVDGKVVSKIGQQSMTLKEIAHVAWRDVARLQSNEEPGLMEYYVYRTPLGMPLDDMRGNFALTYSASACIVVVEVDPETGVVHVRRIRLIEDSGNKINPMIVDGMIHGQLAHQLGAALFERIKYNDEGQLETSSFMDYLATTSADLPPFEIDSITTPSLFSPLGTRGTAEGGGAPLIAAVNAIEDALSQYGIHVTSSYLDPVEIRESLLKARSGNRTSVHA